MRTQTPTANQLAAETSKSIRRRTLLLGVIAGAAPMAAPLPVFAMDEQERCMKVVESQLKAFMRKDYDGAYAHAAPVIQRMYPNSDAFAQMVSRGYAAIFDPSSYAFGRAMERDGQRVQEVFITDSSGVNWVALYSLAEFGEDFRITGVFLQKGGRST